MKKKKTVKKVLPGLKKDIKDFCLKEEGRIDKKSMAKLGLALAMMSVALEKTVSAAHDQGVHENYFTDSGTRSGHHSGNSAHSSHGSHGSHGQW